MAPAPTTASKETPSAPPSRKLRSIHQASSRSLRPEKRSCGERREHLVRERASATHERDLVLVLDGAERLDEPARGHGIDARVDQSSVERVRQVLLLELDPATGQKLADGRDEPARRLDDVEAFERAGAVRVAEVGVQRRRPVRAPRALPRSSSAGRSGSGRSPAPRGRTAARRRGAALRAAPRGARSGSLPPSDDELERLAVAVGAFTDEARGGDVLEHGESPPLLALVDVREMHLHHRRGEELERIADRPRVVRPRAGVRDDSVRPLERLVAPVDVLALVVRLPAARRALRARAPTGRSSSRARRG